MSKNTRLTALQAERILTKLTEQGHVLSASSDAVHVEVPAALFDEMSAWGAEEEDAEMDDGYGEASFEQESQFDLQVKAPRRIFVTKPNSAKTIEIDQPALGQSWADYFTTLVQEYDRASAETLKLDESLKKLHATFFGSDDKEE